MPALANLVHSGIAFSTKNTYIHVA